MDLGRARHGAQGEARGFSVASILLVLLLSQIAGWEGPDLNHRA